MSDLVKFTVLLPGLVTESQTADCGGCGRPRAVHVTTVAWPGLTFVIVLDTWSHPVKENNVFVCVQYILQSDVSGMYHEELAWLNKLRH